MKILKRLLEIGIIANFLFTSILQAEELESTKKSSQEGLFSKVYSSALFRNLQEKAPSDSFKNTWEARYTLGSTFFNDFMTAQITFRLANPSTTATVVDKGTFIETFYNVYSGKYVYFVPVLELYFPGTGKSNITIGLGSTQGLIFNTGDFSFGLDHCFYVWLGTEHNKVDLLSDGVAMTERKDIPDSVGKSFNLNVNDEKKTVQVDQRSSSLAQIAVLTTKWKPSFLRGFSTGLNGYLEQDFTPQMEYARETQKISVARTKFLGIPRYSVANTLYGRLRFAYEFTKNTNFDLDTYLYNSGNLELRSTLTVKLF